jgi:hypothetical protein
VLAFLLNHCSLLNSTQRASSIETLSPAHMPHLFQPSNLDTLFPLIQHTSTHDTSAAVSASSSLDRSIILTYSSLQDEVLTPESYLLSSQHSTRSVPTSSHAAEFNLFDMSIPPLLAHNDVIELTDDEDDAIKISSDPDNEDEEMVVDDMLVSNCIQHNAIPVPQNPLSDY